MTRISSEYPWPEYPWSQYDQNIHDQNADDHVDDADCVLHLHLWYVVLILGSLVFDNISQVLQDISLEKASTYNTVLRQISIILISIFNIIMVMITIMTIMIMMLIMLIRYQNPNLHPISGTVTIYPIGQPQSPEAITSKVYN